MRYDSWRRCVYLKPQNHHALPHLPHDREIEMKIQVFTGTGKSLGIDKIDCNDDLDEICTEHTSSGNVVVLMPYDLAIDEIVIVESH